MLIVDTVSEDGWIYAVSRAIITAIGSGPTDPLQIPDGIDPEAFTTIVDDFDAGLVTFEYCNHDGTGEKTGRVEIGRNAGVEL